MTGINNAWLSTDKETGIGIERIDTLGEFRIKTKIIVLRFANMVIFLKLLVEFYINYE